MKTTSRILFVVMMVAAAQAPVDLEAQQRGSRADREMSREQMQERVQQAFEQRMARALDLSEEQQARMREALGDFREARRELMPQRRELQMETRRFMSGDRNDDERARELIRARRELRETELRLQREEEERLLQILSPSQVLRMQMLRDEFGERIRSLEAGPRAGRMRPGGMALRGGPGWRGMPPRGLVPFRGGPWPEGPRRLRGPRGGGPGDH
jgi:Spy/CpxP family protein refolding chaperone